MVLSEGCSSPEVYRFPGRRHRPQLAATVVIGKQPGQRDESHTVVSLPGHLPLPGADATSPVVARHLVSQRARHNMVSQQNNRAVSGRRGAGYHPGQIAPSWRYAPCLAHHEKSPGTKPGLKFREELSTIWQSIEVIDIARVLALQLGTLLGTFVGYLGGWNASHPGKMGQIGGR